MEIPRLWTVAVVDAAGSVVHRVFDDERMFEVCKQQCMYARLCFFSWEM